MDGAVVVTCTENGTAVLPFSVAEGGEGKQVEAAGAPLQLSATIPLNPLIGVTSRSYVAALPAGTVPVAEPPGARPIEKSVPVPLSPTACGLPGALSVNFNDAVSPPVVLGVKVTFTTQLPLTATLVPVQVWPLNAKSPAFAPLIAIALIVRAELPLFVTVMLIAMLFTVSC